MRHLVVFPYLRAKENRVRVDEWCHLNDDGRPLGELFPDWDPNTPIRIFQRAQVDVTGILKDCALEEGASLSLSVSWYSPGTSLRGCGSSVPLIPCEGVQSSTLELTADGGLLAGELRVKTCVLLMETRSKSPVAPHLTGSILWENEKRVLLEGQGARFPLEIVDFGEQGWLPSGAGWFLDWDPDLPQTPLLGGVRLLINSRHKAIVEAVTASNPCREQKLIRSSIFHDVGRSMIRGILDSEEFLNDPDGFEEGTAGYHVGNLIRAHFPSQTVLALKTMMHERKEHFEAELKAALRLFNMD